MLLTAVAAALVAAAVLVGIWVAGGPGAGPPGSPEGGPAAATLPPSPVTARIAVPGRPRQLVVDGKELWVVTERRLHRIDTSTNRVVAGVAVGGPTVEPGGLALTSAAVWVPGQRSELLWRVDRATNRVSGRVRLGLVLYGPVGMAVRGDTLWVSCCALREGPRPQGQLLRVDTRRRRVTGRIPVPDGPLAVVADRQAVWVGTARGSLLRIDPAAGRVVARVPPPDPHSRIQALSPGPGGVLWVADTGAGVVRRFDRRAGRFELGVPAPAPRNLAAVPDGAWVVTDLNQLLSRVDGRSGRRSAPIPLPYVGGVRGVATGPDAVWVTTGDQVVRIDPTRSPH